MAQQSVLRRRTPPGPYSPTLPLRGSVMFDTNRTNHMMRVPSTCRRIAAAIVIAAISAAASSAAAQQFLLTTPTGGPAGTATLSRTGLVMTDRAGVATRYDREPRYDNAAGSLLGFIDRQGEQALRFPADGDGSLQFADLAALRPQFAVAQVRVQPAGGVPAGDPAPATGGLPRGAGNPGANWRALPLLPVGPADVRGPHGRLTTLDARQRGLVLHTAGAGPVQMAPPAADVGQYWAVLPVDLGLVRLQWFGGGALWSLAASGPAGPAIVQPSSSDPRQLWRVVEYGVAARLDSVAFPGRSLAGGADALVHLERTSGAAAQQWLIDFGPPPVHIVLPTVQLIGHRVVANPPLPVAEVLLTNSHQQDLYVVIADLRPGHGARQLTIPAHGAVTVPLSRDSGATLQEIYEVQSPGGGLVREQLVTVVPPATRYDVSVYERFLQSIAIDRTGKSPNVIEDVNYQPKGVGIFPLPAGPALADGAAVDVWAEARAAGNPGAVRPLAPEPTAELRIDPLQRALEEATR